jgi:hypothetical protein
MLYEALFTSPYFLFHPRLTAGEGKKTKKRKKGNISAWVSPLRRALAHRIRVMAGCVVWVRWALH